MNASHSSPMEWAAKVFAALALAVITPTTARIGLLTAPATLDFTPGRLIVSGILVALWAAILIYNAAIWIGFGQHDSTSWLAKSIDSRSTFSGLALYPAVVIGTAAVLWAYNQSQNPAPVIGLHNALIPFALFFSLSVFGLRAETSKDPLAAWLNERLSGAQAEWVGLVFIGGLLIIGALQNGILWQGMANDTTISLYVSQTIAAGGGPYEKYIILHPPMAYIPGALALQVGRIVGLEDVIAHRFGTLFMVLWSSYLVYRISLSFTGWRTAAFLSAGSFGWITILLTTAFGSPTKIIAMLLSLLMIRALQQSRWLLTGIISVLLALSWAGAAMFLAVPLTLILFSQSSRRRFFLHFLVGVVIAVGMLTLYLSVTGTTQLFFQQYLGGMLSIIVSKARSGEPANAMGQGGLLTLTNRLADLPNIDLAIFVGGMLSLLYFAYTQTGDSRGYFGKLTSFLGNPKKSPVILLALAALGLSLLDFQSLLDIIPSIPSASIMLGWAYGHFICEKIPEGTDHRPVWRSLYATLLIVGVFIFRSAQPISSFPATLQSQMLASSWMDGILEENDTIQVIGNTYPLIFTQRENATRILHLGPKTLLALEAEHQSLEQFTSELLAIAPRYILVDKRNTEQSYLGEFFSELLQNYEVIQFSGSRGEYSRIYYLKDDPRAMLVAQGMSIAFRSPSLFLAYQKIMAGNTGAADDFFRQTGQDDPRLLNLSLIRRAYLQMHQQKYDQARSLLEASGRRGLYSIWGKLALSTFYMETGNSSLASEYYTSVFGEPPPGAFEHRGPALFALPEFPDLEVIADILIGEDHRIISYEMEKLSSDQVLLTLWWWTPNRVQDEIGSTLFQWLDASGQIIAESQIHPTYFYPEAGIRWSYLLEFPPADETAAIQVGLIQRDGNAVFGEPITTHFGNDE